MRKYLFDEKIFVWWENICLIRKYLFEKKILHGKRRYLINIVMISAATFLTSSSRSFRKPLSSSFSITSLLSWHRAGQHLSFFANSSISAKLLHFLTFSQSRGVKIPTLIFSPLWICCVAENKKSYIFSLLSCGQTFSTNLFSSDQNCVKSIFKSDWFPFPRN